jgi:hypothetical protein
MIVWDTVFFIYQLTTYLKFLDPVGAQVFSPQHETLQLVCSLFLSDDKEKTLIILYRAVPLLAPNPTPRRTAPLTVSSVDGK